ncbi:hypothetical protein [Paenibacillus pini]|uniref:hypothetical protein n=1 Tax=Paenibacillus pini TaxID=669461 RepID=UPI000568A186|nr:hypothetical protein [Paenibacillus pini]
MLSKKKFIAHISLTSDLKSSIIEILQSSPITYEGFTLNPQHGLVLHIPFEAPVQIKHTFYTKKIKEMYLFLEHDAKTIALLFYESEKGQSIVVLNYDPEKFMTKNHLQ